MKDNTSEKSTIKERLFAIISGILILLIALITATQALCYWIPNWWRNEYEKYNTPQYVTGEMSLDDAVYITEQMLEYCIGRLDTLDDTEATIDGVTAPFFTDREKSHLSDCRDVFSSVINFRTASILLTIGLLFAIYYSIKKRTEKTPEREQRELAKPIVRKRFAVVLSQGYLISLAILVVLALILVVIGMQNFTYLFTEFHHVFFDNDLWLLDPSVDNLVNVMQEDVFADAAMDIGLMWAGFAAILACISGAVIGKNRNK